MPMMVQSMGHAFEVSFPVCRGAKPVMMTAYGEDAIVRQAFTHLDPATADRMWVVKFESDTITQAPVIDGGEIDLVEGWEQVPPIGDWWLDFGTSDGYEAVVRLSTGANGGEWYVGVDDVALPVDWSDGDAVAQLWCANRSSGQ